MVALFVSALQDLTPDPRQSSEFRRGVRWVLAELHEQVAALRLPADPPPQTRDAPPNVQAWVCFHCSETFTTFGSARDHFGASPDAVAGCLIDRVAVERGGTPERGRGLLMALRKAEARIAELQPAPIQPASASNMCPACEQRSECTVLREIAITTGLTCDQLLGLQPMPASASRWWQTTEDVTRQSSAENAASMGISAFTADEAASLLRGLEDIRAGRIVPLDDNAPIPPASASLCACGTTLVCPDIGCDLHKVSPPGSPRTDEDDKIKR